jgi:hypothetical protein
LCDGEPVARLLLQSAESNPKFARLSIAAVGLCEGRPCCTGVYATPAEMTTAGLELLGDASLRRPTVLWLSGQIADGATIKAVPDPIFTAQAA